ncbi:MAG: UDP-2,3-diacylglucosamine diphosphatase [Flavobacteriia bacterium]|nr:UDP-2,3-diacylglucosamine diphosphatase [Flavobacteriia bacterium]
MFFASDFHLGTPTIEKSREREKKICAWLDEIKPLCKELFLLGDIFDFWFEYKQAIPKYFVRIQAKIAEFTDAGIPVHLFTGNHDMWIFDYLPDELGVHLYRNPKVFERDNKKLYIGHGDGLGPGDYKYKFIKKVFQSKVCQWLFARLHPNFGLWLAQTFSRGSRKSTGLKDEIFYGEDKERLIQYCKKISTTEQYDYFLFGHRHLPLEIKINETSTYINTGDWIKYFTYAIFEKGEVKLCKYEL